MENSDLLLIWMTVILGLMVLMFWVLATAFRALLRHNSDLTMLLSARNEANKGTEYGRAHVAAIKELKKKADKVASGVPSRPSKPIGKAKPFTFKQVTP